METNTSLNILRIF